MAWQLPVILGITRAFRGWFSARKKDEYYGFSLKNFVGSIVLAIGLGVALEYGLTAAGVTDILQFFALQAGITWFGTDVIEDVVKA